jgi:type III secretory pathway component EscU
MDKLEWGLIGVVVGYAISDTVGFFVRQYKFRKALKMLMYLHDMEDELKKRTKEGENNDDRL